MFEPARSGMAGVLGVCVVLWSSIAQAAVDGDPTQPPGAIAAHGRAGTAALVLSYTRISPGGRQALINGRLVEEGEYVSGLRVRRIERGRVHLQGAVETVTLELTAGRAGVTAGSNQGNDDG